MGLGNGNGRRNGRMKKAIERVAREIYDRFRPRRVLLCGSYAYGRPDRDSDVDLLVILDGNKSNMRRALEISRAISHPFPMDLVVLKPSDVRRRLDGGDLVLREMLEKGKELAR